MTNIPLISTDEKDNIVLEWWFSNRKITMYPVDKVLLKVWGLCTETEMEEIGMEDLQAVRDAFTWLFGD